LVGTAVVLRKAFIDINTHKPNLLISCVATTTVSTIGVHTCLVVTAVVLRKAFIDINT
jgi:hypothetical protein